MKKGKEFRSKYFARNPIFHYLDDKDKYLFAVEKPRFKFNIIGCGLMGMEHMRITMAEGQAIIHGIYDINPMSIVVAKQMFFTLYPGIDLTEYDSLEDACNDPAVDGLIICTPNYTHLEVLKVAMKSGKHILLEKPMATTVLDAYEILKLAKDYNAVLQIGLQYRYKAISVEAIHEALERQSLGKIHMVSIMEHRVPFLDKVNQWNKFIKFSGGTLVEKCCHYFDLINLFAQAKPKTVYAMGKMAVNFKEFEYEGEKSDILDSANVVIEYENGIQANFNLCMFAPMFYEEIIICGEEGRLKATENEDYLPAARPKTHVEVMRGEGYPSRISTPMYPKYIEEDGHSGATYFEHKNFIANIQGKETNTATVEEGFWSIIVGAAAEESVKTGKIVRIEEFLKSKSIKNYR
ncbi:MAG: gfo/Idh/MocA family oxidoreductase [Candidatus Heimdallarchaeota archaeon]|nr:gfo/Idh/MocA family oxidoreductase [Candidatus Heimdallarchaeota archaeon]